MEIDRFCNFLLGERDSFRGRHQLILHIVKPMDNPDDMGIKFFYRNIYAQQIDVKGRFVPSQDIRDIAIIDGIDQILMSGVYAVERPVDLNMDGFSEIGIHKGLTQGVDDNIMVGL